MIQYPADQAKKASLFAQDFTMALGHEPTSCQKNAIDAISEFLFSTKQGGLHVLNGYAGTGKTTLISAFVKALDQWKIPNQLLAPTGRAAKVLGGYAGKPAYTIHRFLYRIFTSKEGKPVIIRRENKIPDTLFIVDEVSMISGFDAPSDMDQEAFPGRNILDDLVKYVYESENCKMVFIGDKAQLPPVGSLFSPALDPDLLNARYNLSITVSTLGTVVRQAHNSGILSNASKIRAKIDADDFAPPILHTVHRDVHVANHYELADELAGAFSYHHRTNAVVITRSNKRANLYNREIRNRILGREQEIEGGDLMMVVKNNYFWLPQSSPAGFIANGDMLEISRIRNTEEKYGFRFADALVRFTDYEGESDFEVKLLLSVIESESASLSNEDRRKLFLAVKNDPEPTIDHQSKGPVSKNPYYNALQVKFAYALTCHKTQGGQWETIFIDQGWLPEERIDKEYMRWLYTAVTRATDKIWLIGFARDYVDDTSK
jgi:exodeoxyribonuclease V